MVWRKFTH